MSIWSSSPLTAPPQTEDVAELRVYLKTTINQLAVMMKELDYVLNGNLDLKNVRVKSLDADRLNVDKLSAITANLGTITAGIIRGISIYGSLISTNETGYPKAELSVTENLFGAYKDADNYVTVTANYSGSPGIYFKAPGNQLILSCGETESSIDSEDRLTLTAQGDLRLLPTGQVIMANLDSLRFLSGGTFSSIIGDIYTQLGSLSDRITALGG